MLSNKATKALMGMFASLMMLLAYPAVALAGEANLVLPVLDSSQSNL